MFMAADGRIFVAFIAGLCRTPLRATRYNLTDRQRQTHGQRHARAETQTKAETRKEKLKWEDRDTDGVIDRYRESGKRIVGWVDG